MSFPNWRMPNLEMLMKHSKHLLALEDLIQKGESTDDLSVMRRSKELREKKEE